MTLLGGEEPVQTLVPDVATRLREGVVDVNVAIAGRRDVLHANQAIPVPIHLVHAQANVAVLTMLNVLGVRPVGGAGVALFAVFAAVGLGCLACGGRDDFVAQMAEATRGGQAHVAGADDCDPAPS